MRPLSPLQRYLTRVTLAVRSKRRFLSRLQVTYAHLCSTFLSAVDKEGVQPLVRQARRLRLRFRRR